MDQRYATRGAGGYIQVSHAQHEPGPSGRPGFVLLLWISTLTDWFAARRMAESEGGRKRVFLIMSIVVNLGLLGYFKYGHFVEENFILFMSMLGVDYEISPGNIILPLGISFYTFQSMSYSFDVYRKHIRPANSMLDFALYVSFFPQLVAGPILRAGFFLQQLAEDNRERVADMGWGIALIVIVATCGSTRSGGGSTSRPSSTGTSATSRGGSRTIAPTRSPAC